MKSRRCEFEKSHAVARQRKVALANCPREDRVRRWRVHREPGSARLAGSAERLNAASMRLSIEAAERQHGFGGGRNSMSP
jgi:hypothetical protein